MINFASCTYVYIHKANALQKYTTHFNILIPIDW